MFRLAWALAEMVAGARVLPELRFVEEWEVLAEMVAGLRALPERIFVGIEGVQGAQEPGAFQRRPQEEARVVLRRGPEALP